ncbi:LamG domain-containing protein [Belliella kenyensis]|uniref:LamG domain-containing protein n=1 Tax=Belliella kenyensis TaxID=1472724 RepID=A0ABV8EMN6_9BACT|nr:LamG domain-containing protein [Belliella kenyensis]MCH7403172.1 LamG domain-containing protein [Belliella kenyensis]MDN3604783.1 LamG domain-containing protein [Belliella kenyensis]
MKNLKYTLFALGLIVFGCDGTYTDDIIPVAPGTDVDPPSITINFPLQGTLIRVAEDVTPLNINFEVKDDIEIESVVLRLNGTEILSVNEFLDYRRLVKTHRYEELGNGEHTLVIEARDTSGKTTTQTVNFEKVEPYTPVYEGEVFYLPFDGDYMELVRVRQATINGSPGFADGVIGRAYRGSSSGYLTLPTDNLRNQEFSAVFWYKVNADPNRAGILVMGPPDTVNPNSQNLRTKGLRLFREAAGANQRIKMNLGNGSGENWFDGGAAADINPTAGEWAHIAVTVSRTNAAVYINGNVVSQGSFAGIDWEGCDILSIGSGAPRFTGWNHLSTQSLIDELRIFNVALTQEKIREIMNAERP